MIYFVSSYIWYFKDISKLSLCLLNFSYHFYCSHSNYTHYNIDYIIIFVIAVVLIIADLGITIQIFYLSAYFCGFSSNLCS